MIEKMMNLLKKWLGKRSVAPLKNESVETPEKKEVKSKKSSLLDTLEAYLFTHY